jgi:hypothetical protein
MESPAPPTGKAELLAELAAWNPPSSDLDRIWDLADRSLAEVTRLTEYEDQKASRLLAAVAFLSAFAGALFATLLRHDAPLPDLARVLPRLRLSLWLATFGIYAVLLVAGACLVVGAMRPRFNIPQQWNTTTAHPSSFLFFEQILRVSPKVWGQAFISNSADDLRRSYIRNAVFETYLISEKIRTKLGGLQRGVHVLQLSALVLSVWVSGTVIIVLVFLTRETTP